MASPTVSTPISDQSDLELQAVSLDVSGNFTDPDATDQLTYSIVSGLPANSGLSIDSASGVISGTINQNDIDAAPLAVVVRATDQSANTRDITLNIITPTSSPAETWPARWPWAAGIYAISNRENHLSTRATWTYATDLVCFQGFYFGQTLINETVGWISTYRSLYPDCKLIQYTIPMWTYPVGTTDLGHKSLQRDTIETYNAEASWVLTDPATGIKLFGLPTSDQRDANMTNISSVCPTVSGVTFMEAFANNYFTKYSQYDDLISLIDGWYIDGADFENEFPRPVIGQSGPELGSGWPDYNVNGIADDGPAEHRAGMLTMVGHFDTYASSNLGRVWSTGSNGGRDYTYNEGTLTGFDWYHSLGDWRLVENAHTRFGITGDGSGGYDVASDISNRGVAEIMKHSLVCHAMCRQTTDNKLGRAYALMHYPMNGGLNDNADARSDTDWRLGEFLFALCMSTEEVMYGCMGRDRQIPWPPLDIYTAVTPGNPSSTRSLGTLSADGTTFTLRTADDTSDGGQWYFTPFDNGYLWLNLATPTGGVKYLSDSASTTSNLPTPPAGKKGQAITLTNGHGSTRNNGADVTSITARPYEGGWVSWVDA